MTAPVVTAYRRGDGWRLVHRDGRQVDAATVVEALERLLMTVERDASVTEVVALAASAVTEPASPAAVVTYKLLEAVGVGSAGEARSLLREAVMYGGQLPRLAPDDVRQVLAGFGGEWHYERPPEPGGGAPRQRGVRHGEVGDDGELIG